MSEPIVLRLKHHRRRTKSGGAQKTWVAAILGKSRKFGFEREFVASVGGEKGVSEYLLDDGQLYEVCELGERSFVEVRDGLPVVIPKAEALRIVAALAEKQQVASDEIDRRIARINSEGGFSMNRQSLSLAGCVLLASRT